MSDEREYVSILDGAADEAPIVIIPDEEEEERDYSEHTSFMSAVVGDAPQEENKREEKLTFLGAVNNFWYYHKSTVIIVLFIIAAFAALFISFGSRKTNDLTVAVCTDKYYSDSEMVALKLVLSEYIEDFNDDTTNTVEADFFVTDNEDYTPTQIAADYNDRVRCIYFTTKEAYAYITEMYPDMFESYFGCDEWIPLEGTSLGEKFKAQGIDVSDLGISLAAKPAEDSENYDRAVKLLDALKEAYPAVFD